MFDIELEVADQVKDLDASGLLAFAGDRRREADRAEAQLLVAAAHWADLHPAGRRAAAGVVLDRWIDGSERVVPLAGPGTPEVAEFAPAELGAALGMSTFAAAGLVGDALELRHRLPRLWRRVKSSDLTVWRARRIADQTKSLSMEAASYVDDQVSWCAHRISPARVQHLVDAALLRFDAEGAAAQAAAAREGRGVWVGDQISTGGTLSVMMEADAVDVAAFDGTLTEIADGLGRLGDPDGVDVRRSKAVGVIADPQGALNLLAGKAAVAEGAEPAGAAEAAVDDANKDVAECRPRVPVAPKRKPLMLYVHLSADAVRASVATAAQTAAAADAADASVARVEGLGPVLAEQVRAWAGCADLRVQPVIDLADRRSVDSYEVPARMSEQVLLRDPCCPFPYCSNLSRHKDNDHVVQFDSGDADQRPPPGQTSPDNLAPLCRRHHRIKTHSAWRYVMAPLGTYLWTSPRGRRYRVDDTGTTPLDTT